MNSVDDDDPFGLHHDLAERLSEAELAASRRRHEPVDGRKQLLVRLPASLVDRLRKAAKTRRVEMWRIVEQAIELELMDEGDDDRTDPDRGPAVE